MSEPRIWTDDGAEGCREGRIGIGEITRGLLNNERFDVMVFIVVDVGDTSPNEPPDDGLWLGKLMSIEDDDGGFM
jgi:hypothetical protein